MRVPFANDLLGMLDSGRRKNRPVVRCYKQLLRACSQFGLDDDKYGHSIARCKMRLASWPAALALSE